LRRSSSCNRLDAFLNRTRVRELHLLTSVLCLHGRKVAAVRRLAGSALTSFGERPREQRDHPPRDR